MKTPQFYELQSDGIYVFSRFVTVKFRLMNTTRYEDQSAIKTT